MKVLAVFGAQILPVRPDSAKVGRFALAGLTLF
jgi:hypothetical protein